MPPEQKLADTRSEILKELDTFNTAPEFGMLGILAEQESQSKPEPQIETQPEKEEKPTPEVDYSKVYAPLNTSIQELSYQQGTRLDNLERTLHELRNNLSARQEQLSSATPAPNFDPDAPVTMAQYMEIVNRQRQAEQSFQQRQDQLSLESARLNAHLALSEYKRSHPEFGMTPVDLDRAFQTGVSRNRNEVLNANWHALFDQVYNQTVLPQRTAELDSLRKKVTELEQELKSSKKQSAPATSQISPPTRTTTRSIQSPAVNSADLDIHNLRSFRKQGHWKEYARDIKRHHGIA
jgi:hypothetical protein